MSDAFYILKNPTVRRVRAIFRWAAKNGLKTELDMLDCSKSFYRRLADRTFEDILGHITRSSVGFFRIILREQENVFGILTDHYECRDLLEVFIRSIDIDGIEYFIFVYMDPEKLEYLKRKYLLEKM